MYLKHNVKLAPHIWSWYAWSHLISPHTAGMNVVERHMKIMESFIEYPDMHYEAINTRGMIGGPFINLPPSKQPIIKALFEKTKKECAKLIQLDADIKAFDKMLQEKAVGGSLEEYYKLLPESLQGMVELAYDMNSHPQIRFIEPILYQRYYDESAQSISLSEIVDDSRPFCLSTPDINDDAALQLKIPFSSKVIDKLMKMKSVSSDPLALVDELNVKPDDVERYMRLFTEEPPIKKDNEFHGVGVRIRYFGHACMLLQTKDVSILIDPVLGYNYDGLQTDRFTYVDLPETIDYVLVTHNHQDHFLLEVLLQLRSRIKNFIVPTTNEGSIADPSMKLVLQHLGFSNIRTLQALDEIDLGGGNKITALPFLGEHGDLDIRSKLGYHVNLCNLSMMFLADSNSLDGRLYDYIFEHTGPVDMMFIGMECVGAPLSWLYGPLLSKPLSRDNDRSRRLSGSNYKKALEIIEKSGAKEVSVYAMGMEPWLGYVMAVDYKPTSLPMLESDKLVEHCSQHKIKSQRLYGKQEWVFAKGMYEASHRMEKEVVNAV